MEWLFEREPERGEEDAEREIPNSNPGSFDAINRERVVWQRNGRKIQLADQS
jgi:hypothetical protein